jgi:ABC-2 type transport system permease protein
MTTLTANPGTTPDVAPAARPAREVPARIPFARVLKVELVKMFDTRSGFWLMIGIAASALIATGAVIAFAPDHEIVYDNFGAAIGIPMVFLLPVMALLSVTSEWSQRSGLTTFTLVPHRNRVLAAKAIVAITVGAVAIGVALAIGALGNLVGARRAGVDPVWDISVTQAVTLVFANVLNLMIGFMLGVLIRNSPGAVVGYFVYGFVLPPLTMLLAELNGWWRDAQPWLDFNYAQGPLYDDSGITGTDWAHLAVTGSIWLLLPLAVGLYLVRRSEVK